MAFEKNERFINIRSSLPLFSPAKPILISSDDFLLPKQDFLCTSGILSESQLSLILEFGSKQNQKIVIPEHLNTEEQEALLRDCPGLNYLFSGNRLPHKY